MTSRLRSPLLLLLAGAATAAGDDAMSGAGGFHDFDLRFTVGYQRAEVGEVDTDGFRLGIDTRYLYHTPNVFGVAVGCNLLYQQFIEDDADLDVVGLRLCAGPSLRFNRALHLEITPFVGAAYGWVDGADGFVLPYGVQAGLYGTTPIGLQVGGKLGYEWAEIDGETDGGGDVDLSADGFFVALTLGARF